MHTSVRAIFLFNVIFTLSIATYPPRKTAADASAQRAAAADAFARAVAVSIAAAASAIRRCREVARVAAVCKRAADHEHDCRKNDEHKQPDERRVVCSSGGGGGGARAAVSRAAGRRGGASGAIACGGRQRAVEKTRQFAIANSLEARERVMRAVRTLFKSNAQIQLPKRASNRPNLELVARNECAHRQFAVSLQRFFEC